jgi:hypothetical protein|tara:strand:+ start:1204 stop:1422 length:219 start_codon:yes stop_codon:yes gene_type:complete
MKIYSVGIYNQTVRNFVRSGEDLPDHVNVSPEFADVLYFDRWADSAEDAKTRIAREYPAVLGYVVDYVEQIK